MLDGRVALRHMKNLVSADLMLRTVSMQSFLNFFNEQISFSTVRWIFNLGGIVLACSVATSRVSSQQEIGNAANATEFFTRMVYCSCVVLFR